MTLRDIQARRAGARLAFYWREPPLQCRSQLANNAAVRTAHLDSLWINKNEVRGSAPRTTAVAGLVTAATLSLRASTHPLKRCSPLGSEFVVAQFTFRCPNTGYIVHIAVEQSEAAADTIEVQCTACKGRHAIDVESGEVVPLLDKLRDRLCGPGDR
jgi:hypothetical protein